MKRQLTKGILLTLVVALMLPIPTYGQSFLVSAEDKDVNFSYLRGMMTLIQSYYVEEVKAEDLVEGAYKGMFDVLDRHSVYLPPLEYEEFNNSLDGDFSGIGVNITKEGDYIAVIAPIEGTPAYDAGLKSGDIIVSVDGENIKGWSMEKTISRIRGERGTLVVIGVQRPGIIDPIEFPIIREDIDIRHVKYEMLDQGIGYMEIESFAEGVGAEVGKGIQLFEEEGAVGMVLDLRGNPGGSLIEALKVSDYFLESGQPIVFIDYRVEEDVEHKANSGKTGLPLVVLVDEGSASASEIVAGAVQDNDAGEIVGVTSYGKGTVQNLIPLTNGAGVKLTVAEYFSPLRHKINTIGVKPDYMVENKKAEMTYNDFAPMIEGGTFKVGDKGLDVYGAQQRLAFLGYSISVDGLFGQGMEEVLSTFQANEKLERNGQLDLKTKQRIKERIRDYIIIGEEDFQLMKAEDLIMEVVNQ
jgi:carboxyl-terminal processing protease